MCKIKLFFCFFVLGFMRLGAQDVKLIRPTTHTNMKRSYYNERMRGIECDSAGFFLLGGSKRSFVVDISIYSSGTFHIESGIIGNLKGVFVNGKKESIWQKYSGGLQREETYKDDLLHGISRVFSEENEILYQTIFINGTGYYKEYYNDNKQLLLEGEMQNGKREGEWLYYFKTGGCSYVENYRNGQLHGTYKMYCEDGKLFYSTEFKNGTGWYNFLNLQDPSGTLLEEGQLENGNRVGKWILTSPEGYKSSIYYTPQSAENKRIHNLIEIVYFYGKPYYIYASDQKSDLSK